MRPGSLKPGFSTAIEADDVSGRGVGLDIVHSNIAKLGGTVRVKTRLGEGTVFTVSVPLTLAVFRALLVTASGQRFVIPLSGVVEVAHVPVSNVKSIGTGEAIIQGSIDYTDKELNLPKAILAKGMESVASVVSDMIGQTINMRVPEVLLMPYNEIAKVHTYDIGEPSIGVQVEMSGDIEG